MSITMPASTQVHTRILRLQGGGLRFLDSREMPHEGFQVVTRPFVGLDTIQHWRVTELGGDLSTIQQVSSGRFLDAHEMSESDFRVVTRPRRDDDTQRWRIQDFGGGFISIQQVSSERFLEATVDGDFTVVTRPAGNSEQTWRIGGP
jgi:hypothetical protein